MKNNFIQPVSGRSRKKLVAAGGKEEAWLI